MSENYQILKDFNKIGVLKALRSNMFGGVLEWSKWHQMKVISDKNFVYTITNSPSPILNMVVRADCPLEDVKRHAKEIIEIANEKKIGFSWWIGSDPQKEEVEAILQQLSFTKVADLQAMAMQLKNLSDANASDLKIIEVSNDEQLKQWNDLVCFIHDFDDVNNEFFAMHKAAGYTDDSSYKHFIGMLNDKVVAASSAYVGPEIVTLSNVGVLPECRNKHFGLSISLYPLLKFYQQGYQIGALWTGNLGRMIYQKIGFEIISESSVYTYIAK